MTSPHEFFLAEAEEYIGDLDAALGPSSDAVDADGVYRSAKALRGSAQMARRDRVRLVAGALEAAARAAVNDERKWDSGMHDRARASIEDIRTLAFEESADQDADRTVDAAVGRWQEIGVDFEPAGSAAARRAGMDSVAPGAVATAGAAADGMPQDIDGLPPGVADVAEPATDEFRVYAAGEIKRIIAALDAALESLAGAPRDHAPLKELLQRERPLLGAAQLDRLPRIAGTLRILEEASQVAVRSGVSVDGDWLKMYRLGREALDSMLGPLTDAEDAATDPASLEELRGLHERLVTQHAEDDIEPPELQETDQPVEVINFFRSEAASLLDRIERMAGALAAATEKRQRALRDELREALTALRDTSRTFGFPEAAETAGSVLGRVRDSGASEMLNEAERLREIVARDRPTGPVGTAEQVAGATEEPTDDAAEPEPVTAGTGSGAGSASAGAAMEDPRGAQPTAEAEDIVPIEELCYRDDAALERALELRQRVETAVTGNPKAREAVDELFDLIRLAMS